MVIPFHHYWLADGHLLGSENPSLLPRSVELVAAIARAHGIHILLSLDADVPDYRIEGLRHVRLPLSNRCVPTPAQLRPAVELVVAKLRRGERLWCHCRHGVDRTGAVLGAALAATGQDPETVIAELIAHFPPGRRTPTLLALWQPYADLIRDWERGTRSGEAPGHLSGSPP